MSPIQYRVLTFDDKDETLEIVCNELFVREPMCKATGIDPVKVGNAFVDAMFEHHISEGISLGAFDSATGRMVGIRLSAVVNKDDKEDKTFSKEDPRTREIALMAEPIKVLYEKINLFEKYEVETIANFRGLCVIEKYQHQGIGTVMVEKALELVKGKGIHLVTAESSGRFSQRIFEKVGFSELANLPYTEFCYEGKLVKMTEQLVLDKQVTLFAKQI